MSSKKKNSTILMASRRTFIFVLLSVVLISMSSYFGKEYLYSTNNKIRNFQKSREAVIQLELVMHKLSLNLRRLIFENDKTSIKRTLELNEHLLSAYELFKNTTYHLGSRELNYIAIEYEPVVHTLRTQVYSIISNYNNGEITKSREIYVKKMEYWDKRIASLIDKINIGTDILILENENMISLFYRVILILEGLILLFVALKLYFVNRFNLVNIVNPIINMSETICRSSKSGSLVEIKRGEDQNEQSEISKLITSFNTMVKSRKELERDLIIEKEKAERATSIKAEFLSNMSHEIRTPMNGVLGMLTLLEESGLNEEQCDLVDTIRTCGDSLLVILNDILDFSKVEASKMKLENNPFELKKCLEDSTSLMNERASQKRIDLGFSIDKNVAPYLLGDVTRIRQIIINLVSNAIKFTEAGGVYLIVSKEICDRGVDLIRFSVRDTGIGIEKKDQVKLFKSFSQVDASTSRKYGGTGLGLAISFKLVKLMGGKMSVESRRNRGSIFTFDLPLSAESEYTPKKKNSIQIDPEMANKLPLSILVAEDNRINQKLARRLLQRLGYIVDIAENGVEAIKALEVKRYDVILMDMQMPELDGPGATKAIIEKYGDSSPYIIAVTANILPSDREKCFKSGMSDFISKPIPINDLISSLYKSKDSKDAS